MRKSVSRLSIASVGILVGSAVVEVSNLQGALIAKGLSEQQLATFHVHGGTLYLRATAMTFVPTKGGAQVEDLNRVKRHTLSTALGEYAANAHGDLVKSLT